MSRGCAKGAGAIPPRTPPHNYEAEQALLGALLANNEVYNRVTEFLRPEHFADALHGRIYEAIGKLIERGQIANPVTLKNLFDQDGALAEIGGAQYLAQLAAGGRHRHQRRGLRPHHPRPVLRRQLIGVGEDIVNEAYTYDLDISAIDQIERAEKRLFDLAEGRPGRRRPEEFSDALTSAIDMAEAAYKRDGHVTGVTTGLRDLDKQARRAAAVRPRHPRRPPVDGQDGARHQHRASTPRRPTRSDTETGDRSADGAVAFFSLEMSAEQLAHPHPRRGDRASRPTRSAAARSSEDDFASIRRGRAAHDAHVRSSSTTRRP